MESQVAFHTQNHRPSQRTNDLFSREVIYELLCCQNLQWLKRLADKPLARIESQRLCQNRKRTGNGHGGKPLSVDESPTMSTHWVCLLGFKYSVNNGFDKLLIPAVQHILYNKSDFEQLETAFHLGHLGCLAEGLEAFGSFLRLSPVK